MMKTEIVYEDNDVLVIYKPAGLATQTAKVGQADVVSELKNHLARQAQAAGKPQTPPYLGVIHRLDQPVEGLLVFAKNQKAAASLTAQLRHSNTGLLNKQYYAVVCGKPSEEAGELVDNLYRDESGKAVVEEGRKTAGRAESEEGRKTAGRAEWGDKERTPKKAVLRYRRAATEVCRNGEEISLLDITIETGRFHQIRAQMAHAGTPLLGDTKYGDEKSLSMSKELSVRNVALCAYGLEFLHPVTGKPKRFDIQPRNAIFSHFEW